jgi:hypothetical protein
LHSEWKGVGFIQVKLKKIFCVKNRKFIYYLVYAGFRFKQVSMYYTCENVEDFFLKCVHMTTRANKNRKLCTSDKCEEKKRKCAHLTRVNKYRKCLHLTSAGKIKKMRISDIYKKIRI